jgi:hypothetical protein
MTPDLKKPSFWRPLQRAPEDAHHQPDDDTPRPPELNALSSPQGSPCVEGWGSVGHHCRDSYRDLKACISAVDQRLMGD